MIQMQSRVLGLHPGRARHRIGEEKNIQIRRAQRLELESTFRRTRVCA